jgi:DNA polymerase-3 subunit beta
MIDVIISSQVLKAITNEAVLATDRKPAVEILRGALITHDKASLSIRCTNTRTDITAIAPTHDNAATPKRICIDAARFHAIISALPDGVDCQIIQIQEKKVILKAGKLKATFATMMVNDYLEEMEHKQPQEITLEPGVINDGIGKTISSAASGDVRSYLNGICIDIAKDSITMIASDGHRLAAARISDTGSDTPISIIIPTDSAAKIAKLIDHNEKVHLKISQKFVTLTQPGIKIDANTVEATYPDWQRLTKNKDYTKKLLINSKQIAESLNRVKQGTDERLAAILAIDKTTISISADNQKTGETLTDSIDVAYQGEPFKIKTNISYIQNAIKCAKEAEVLMNVDSENSQILFEAENYKSIVMPMVN